MANNVFLKMMAEYTKVQKEVDRIHDGIMEIHNGLIGEREYKQMLTKACDNINYSMNTIAGFKVGEKDAKQIQLWILGLGAVVNDIEEEINRYGVVMCREVLEKVTKMMNIRNELAEILRTVQTAMA